MTDPVRPPSGYPTSLPPSYPPPQGTPGQPQAQPFAAPPMAGPHQPGPYPPGPYPPGPMPVVQPSPRWALSIVGFVFSFVFGGVALYFSSQVQTRWQQGDAAGAEKASNMAQLWAIIAIVVGVLFFIIVAGSGGY